MRWGYLFCMLVLSHGRQLGRCAASPSDRPRDSNCLQSALTPRPPFHVPLEKEYSCPAPLTVGLNFVEVFETTTAGHPSRLLNQILLSDLPELSISNCE